MTHLAKISLLVACLVFAACENPKQGPNDESTPSPVESSSAGGPSISTGTWRVGRIDVRRGASPQSLELPGPETVGGWLETEIRKSEDLEATQSESNAFLSYTAAVVDGIAGIPEDEQPFVRVRVQGQLTAPDQSEQSNELMALGIERDISLADGSTEPDPSMLSEELHRVIQEYVAVVQARHDMLTAPKDELVDLLADESLPAEALLTGVHEARDRRIDAAVGPLTELLEHDAPSVVVASAAALAQLAPEQSAGKIVEAAGRLGREREYATLHRMIFVIGDIESPVVREYLEGLETHQIPDIRRAAEQVLRAKEPRSQSESP